MKFDGLHAMQSNYPQGRALKRICVIFFNQFSDVKLISKERGKKVKENSVTETVFVPSCKV
jgi:hypothetical protein